MKNLNCGFLFRIIVFVLVGPSLFCCASEARQYEQALPGYIYKFPQDHYSHEGYKTEWWYFTGHLHGAHQEQYGYELTFFRTGLHQDESANSTWNLRNLYLAHFAITDPAGHKFFFSEKLNRAGAGVAGAKENQALVFNENWSMEMHGDKIALKADTPEYGIKLELVPFKPLVVHGTDGVSQKANCKGCASHYYSYTRLATTGTVCVGKSSVAITGLSWMDHEFGSNQLTKQQVGWDWFSLQLDNNCEAMLYVMRNVDGTLDPNSSGTIVSSDGKATHLLLSEFKVEKIGEWKSPKSGATYPMGWTISIPKAQAVLRVDPLMREQELVTNGSTGVTYWEGASTVSGTFNNRPVAGEAYVEMTGYAEMFKERI